jgi:hypothetical protein
MTKLPSACPPAVSTRPFEAGDTSAVLGLLQSAFGQWPRNVPGTTAGEFFHWKHELSPFGASTLLVAEANGAVIGFYAHMPWRLQVRGEAVAAMRGVDLAVHPAFRRLGASTALRAAAGFPADVALLWSNPNDESRPGGVKLGRRSVGRLPRFVQPCGRLRETLRRARGRQRGLPDALPVEARTAAEVLGDGASASELAPRPRAREQRLSTARDLDYLRWRYGMFGEYRAIRAHAGGRGVVIFRCRRHGPFWVSHVCELLVEPGDRRTARRLLRRVREAAPADFVTCNFSGARAAARYGFAPYRGGETLTILPLTSDLEPDPTERRSWALSHGDLELL